MTPRVSVVVPFFRTDARLFARCIDSLKAQTLPEIEILFVSDGSPDGSALEFLETLASDDRRFRLIRLDANRGVSTARNTGIDASRGDFVGFVDADDACEPEMFRTLYEAARDSGADLTLCAARLVDSDGNERHSAYFDSISPRDASFDATDRARTYLYNKMDWSVWNKLFSRKCLGKFEPDFWLAEDKLFSVTAFFRAEKFRMIPQKLYRYTENPGSVMRTLAARRLESVRLLIRAQERIHALAASSGTELKRRILADSLRILIVTLIPAATHCPDPAVASEIRSLVCAFQTHLREHARTEKIVPFGGPFGGMFLRGPGALAGRFLLKRANLRLDRETCP